MQTTTRPSTVDGYIAGFPDEDQRLLRAMREAVRAAAPDAEEVISYGMPTFRQAGNVVHFAAFKNHIGFYPAPSGLVQFEAELTKYKGSKGAVQFPKDQPLPLDLVQAITRYRLAENLRKAAEKKSKK